MHEDNTRHFTVLTAAGKEEIYCLDMDDSHEHEVWFIFRDHPPRIFQRAALISRQEHPPFDQKKWDEIVRRSQLPEPTYEPPSYEDE